VTINAAEAGKAQLAAARAIRQGIYFEFGISLSLLK
jgi:hypothetical protein